MSDDKTKNRLSLQWLAIELAVICSVISQISPVSKYARPAMYIAWGLALAMGCVKNHGKIYLSNFTKSFIILYIGFISLTLITGLFENSHATANYIHVLTVPLLVTIVGETYANEDKELFVRIAWIYVLSALVLAVWVHLTYYRSYSSWLSSRIYIYQSKNSAGQIWCSAIFIAILYIDYRKRSQRAIGYLISAYLLFITGISQCRTAIFGICVAIVCYAVSRSKRKFRWIVGILIGIGVVWNIPVARQFIEQALFLNKYRGADLNTFSSGRIGHWEDALAAFASSPIIGTGQYYVDCSYLLILAESGLLGLLLIEPIWIMKIKQCLSVDRAKKGGLLLFFLTFFYIIESVLEGYPPFGPGVSSFMYWFLGSVIVNAAVRDNMDFLAE